MKTIGILGGLSWESSAVYYQLINEEVNKRLGGLHSAKLLMYSFDFAPIEKLQHEDNWNTISEMTVTAASALERAGAELIIIASNTIHKVAGTIEKATSVPLLHIADATAEALLKNGIRKAGLTGTAFTMEQDFYKKRLREKYGIEVIIPEREERRIIHRIIYEELVLGKILDSSREKFREIFGNLAEKGAEGIILGCTEIGMLVKAGDAEIPLFDTTELHAKAAVEYALKS